MKRIAYPLTFLLLIALLFSGCSFIRFSAEITTPQPKVSATPSPDTENEISPTKATSNVPSIPDPTSTPVSSRDYSVDIPAGWELEHMGTYDLITAPDKLANVTVVSENLSINITTKEYYWACQPYLSDIYKDATDIHDAPSGIGDFYECSFLYTTQGITLRMTQYYLVSNSTAYVLTYSRMPDADNQTAINEMLRTFKAH